MWGVFTFDIFLPFLFSSNGTIMAPFFREHNLKMMSVANFKFAPYNRAMIATSVIIAGPTASGKSDFAHRLALRTGGVIINCDSVQIYHGIENIAASPFAGRPITPDIDGVPYRFPATKPTVSIFPIPIIRGQVPPRSASS